RAGPGWWLRSGLAPSGFPWPVLAVVSGIVLVAQIPLPHATAWHFFDEAADLLVGDEGLGLYAARPDLQFGPGSIAVALPFAALGSLGSWAAMLAFSAVGIWVVWLLMDSVRRLRPNLDQVAFAQTQLFAGVLFILVWGDVAIRTAHIDDGITIAAAATAVWAIARGRPWWVVVSLAVAGAAKPWGLIFAPLAAVLPGRYRWVRVALVFGLAGLTWAPFVIAEAATLDASSFDIANEMSSSLRVLGVTAATTPDWVRPLQLVGGTAIAAALVWRGRWSAVLMAGVAFRLLIDPAANRYYTVGLVLGLLVFELLRRPAHRPWLAVVAAAVLELGQVSWFPATLSGWIRLVVTVGVLGLAFAVRPEPVSAVGTAPPHP
ncbi:MAG: hypothetical protein GY778_29980, partial [bacterium]|nr:hypothetical protein [bacterium]